MEKRIGNVVIKYIRAKRALTKSSLGFYTLNHYVGCTHACEYCYAKLYARKFHGLSDWGRTVFVKKNVPELLRKEARRGMHVWLSSMSDPYQPVEAIEGLTRRVVEILGSKGVHIDILTKNPLVLKDLDLLVKYGATVGFTIISTKPHPLEKNVPHPRRRIDALKKVKAAGLKTYVFIGPILPETDVERIISMTKKYTDLYYIDKLRHVKELGLDPYRPDKESILRYIREEGVRAKLLF